MSQSLSEEYLIRNYFLDELPERDQDLMDERLLKDPEFLLASQIIEDELMDDYALGLLSPNDRLRLEEGLLKSPKQFRKVQLTRTIELFALKSDIVAPRHEEPNQPAEIAAQGLRHLIEEESVARKYVVARYQMLIDRKYLNGLSPSENEELDSLKAALDAMDKPYYDRIINCLSRLVEQREV